MHAIEAILSTARNGSTADPATLEGCLEACAECALACTGCADACLGEKNVDTLRRCIRRNHDCADACNMTARVLARQLDGDIEFLRAQLEACARICASCGAECQRHASHHEHCRICADACRRCEEACRKALQALPAGS